MRLRLRKDGEHEEVICSYYEHAPGRMLYACDGFCRGGMGALMALLILS